MKSQENQIFRFNLVSPESLLFSEKVEMVILPGEEGDMGILYNHAPVLSSLKVGIVDVYQDGISSVTKRFFVGGGFASVNSEECVVLTDKAVLLPDLDSKSLEKYIQEMKSNFIMGSTKL
jgi:F-type H+-transporting ATPase subunit epsilon